MELIQKELLYAALGTGATCLATVLGAAMVFFFRHAMSHILQKAFLGFAAGVMIAASVWSLLIPAMEMAEAQGRGVLLPVGGGFVLGGAFLMLLDNLLPHLHIGSDEAEGLPAHWKRTTMIVLAVTLHNIPEGMAVGLSFSVAAQDPAPGALAGAAELSGGGRRVPADEIPGSAGGQGLFVRCRQRRGGASLRVDHCAGGRQRGRYDALGTVLCGRGDDLRGGRRADSGGPAGRALPCRNPQCHGGIFGDDAVGCIAGNVTVCDMWRNVAE